MKMRMRISLPLLLGAPAFLLLYFLPDLTLGRYINHLNLDPNLPELRGAFQPMLVYKVGCACVVCGMYGFFRFTSRFPIRDLHGKADYGNWLRTTSWTSRLPLPFGPVSLTVADAAALAGFAALVHFTTPYSAAWPLISFGATYCVVGMAIFCDSAGWAACLLAFGLALIIRVLEHPWVAFSVVAGMYGICLMALPRALDRASWMGDLDRKSRAAKLGWPFDSLGPVRPQPQTPFSSVVLIAAMVGWWVYCVLYQIEIRAPQIYGGPAIGLVIVGAATALFRFFVYFAGFAWPISPLGRIATGRWIIPAYDQIVVAPICILFVAMVLGLIPIPGMISPAVYCGISVAMLLAIAIGMKPSLQTWRLTGGHRIYALRNGDPWNSNSGHGSRSQIVKTTA